jgi:hypothetical protein
LAGLAELRKPLSSARKSMTAVSGTPCALGVMQRRAARALFLAGAKMGQEEINWTAAIAIALLIALIMVLALAVSASVL